MILYLLATMVVMAECEEVVPALRTPAVCDNSTISFFTKYHYSYDDFVSHFSGKTFVKTLSSYTVKDKARCIYYSFDFEKHEWNYTETYEKPCGSIGVYEFISPFTFHCTYVEINGARFYFKLFDDGVLNYFCAPESAQGEYGSTVTATVAVDSKSYYKPCTQSTLKAYSLTYRALGFPSYYVAGPCCFGPHKIFVRDDVKLDWKVDVKTLHEIVSVEDCPCKRCYAPCTA